MAMQAKAKVAAMGEATMKAVAEAKASLKSSATALFSGKAATKGKAAHRGKMAMRSRKPFFIMLDDSNFGGASQMPQMYDAGAYNPFDALPPRERMDQPYELPIGEFLQ